MIRSPDPFPIDPADHRSRGNPTLLSRGGRGVGRSHALLAALILTTVSCASTAPPEPRSPRFHYTIAPEPFATVPGVTVELTIETGGESFLLSFPPGSTFARLEAPLIDEWTVIEGRSDAFEETSSPFAWVYRGRGRTTLRYRVPHRFRDLELVRSLHDGYEFPYLERDHGLLYTPTLLLLPELDGRGLDASGVACTIEWDLPRGWAIETPWGEGPVAVSELRDDYCLAGAWHRRVIDLGAFQATLAFAPEFRALAATITPRVREILLVEFDMFGVVPRGKYLFVFGPSEGAQFGGSPKRSSMTLAFDPVLAAHPPPWLTLEISHLVAHEFHHTWTHRNPPWPDDLRWVTEGFTDYMAWLICARLEQFTPTEWRGRLAEMLVEIDDPALADTSLAEAGGPAFFSGGAGVRLRLSRRALPRPLARPLPARGGVPLRARRLPEAVQQQPALSGGRSNPR